MTLLIPCIIGLILGSSVLASTPANSVGKTAVIRENTNRPTNRPKMNRPVLHVQSQAANSVTSGTEVVAPTATPSSDLTNRPTDVQTASGYPSGGGESNTPGSTNGPDRSQTNGGIVGTPAATIPPIEEHLGEIGIPTGEVLVPDQATNSNSYQALGGNRNNSGTSAQTASGAELHTNSGN